MIFDNMAKSAHTPRVYFYLKDRNAETSWETKTYSPKEQKKGLWKD